MDTKKILGEFIDVLNKINRTIKDLIDGVTIAKNKGTLSPNNSSTTPLGIGGVFTGVVDDIKDYAAVSISIWANQASATDGLSIEWSQDGTNWDEKMNVSIGKEKVESYEFGARARYFRLVYTNGAIAQTAFRLQVMYHPVRTRHGSRCLCVDIDPREFAPTRRAIIAAKKPDGTYENVHSTAGANLKVSVEEFDPSVYKTTLIDDYTTANKTYIGKAVAGASEGALVWQIKCLDETGNFLKIGFADGVSTFTKEWDDRTTYTYT